MSSEILDFLIQFKESGLAESTSDLVKLSKAFATATGAAAKLDQINAKGAASFQIAQQKQIGAVVLSSKKASDARELAQLKSKLKREELEVKSSLKVQAKAKSTAGPSALKGAGASSGGAPGLGSVGGVASSETSMAGAAEAAGALASGLLIVATAFAAATTAGALFAISQVSAKQSLQISLGALLGNQQAGEELQQKLEDLGKTLPVTGDRVNDLGVALVNAGVSGDRLTSTIKALAAVEATVGAEGAEKIKTLIEKWNAVGHVDPLNARALAGTGVTIDAFQKQLASSLGKTPKQIAALLKNGKISASQGIDAINAVIQERLGNVAAKKLGSLPVQLSKLKDLFGNLFDDVDIGAFSSAFQHLVSLLDSSTATGKVLKTLMNAFFGEVFSLASKALPYVEYGFKAILIAGLKTYIALKAFSQTPLFDKIVTGLKIVGGVILAVAAVAAVGGALLMAPFLLLATIAVGAVGLFVTALGYIPSILGAVWGAAQVIWGRVTEFAASFFSIGANIVQGIIDGVTAGAGALVDAVTNLGTTAYNTLKNTLGIHSPSKVFMDLGGHTAAGFALGVDKGAANDVAPAVGAMVSPSAGAAQAGGSKGGGNTISISFTIVTSSGANNEEIANTVLEKLMGALEGTGASIGAASAEAA